MNFFAYFNLKETVFIKKKKLKRQYYSLQRRYHPDLVKKNTEKSKKINSIYKILKNSLKRTKYFLSLQKININDKEFLKKKKKKFLIIQFMLNEEIYNLKKKKKFLRKLKFLYLKYKKEMFLKIKKKDFHFSAYLLYKLFFFKKIILNF